MDNPVYQRLREWPIGWVFENRHGEIVGHIANVPLSYEFEGRTILAATSGDLVVDPCYRIYAFQLLGHFLSQRNVDLFVNNTANPNSSKALEKFRAPRVPAGAWDKAAFWITNYQGFLKCLLRKKHLPLANTLSLLLSGGLRLTEKVTRKSLKIKHHDLEVRSCDQFDERFDEFWEALKRSHPSILLATRSLEVLDWHFKYSLVQKKTSIVVVIRASQMLAYSLFTRYENPKNGLKKLRLIDFHALGGRNELLIPMLDCGLKRCEAEGFDMLEAIGFAPSKQMIIDQVAPYSRELRSWLYFYKAKDSRLARKLKDPGVWDPSCFDGDASL